MAGKLELASRFSGEITSFPGDGPRPRLVLLLKVNYTFLPYLFGRFFLSHFGCLESGPPLDLSPSSSDFHQNRLHPPPRKVLSPRPSLGKERKSSEGKEIHFLPKFSSSAVFGLS